MQCYVVQELDYQVDDTCVDETRSYSNQPDEPPEATAEVIAEPVYVDPPFSVIGQREQPGIQAQ